MARQRRNEAFRARGSAESPNSSDAIAQATRIRAREVRFMAPPDGADRVEVIRGDDQIEGKSQSDPRTRIPSRRRRRSLRIFWPARAPN